MTATITLAVGDTLRQAAIIAALIALDYAGVLAALLADLRSGTLRSRREGRPITSRGFRRTVEKASHYFITLGAMTVVDVLLLGAVLFLRASGAVSLPPLPVFTTLGAIGLALIELKSIMENNPEGSTLVRMARRLRGCLTKPGLAAIIRAFIK